MANDEERMLDGVSDGADEASATENLTDGSDYAEVNGEPMYADNFASGEEEQPQAVEGQEPYYEYEGEEAQVQLERGDVAGYAATASTIKRSRISYERKKRLYGYGFIAIWLIGTIYMFVIPMFTSLWYSLCNTTIVNANLLDQEPYASKMSGPGIYAEWNDFKNYNDAFNVDADYPKNLAESLTSMPLQAATILVFSLFIAILLNQKFKGRTLARAVFFVPVLIATGPIISVINGDIAAQGVGEASQFSALFSADFVDQFLEFLGLANVNQEFATQVGDFASDIFNLVWKAGIQILIFLSALQQIPVSAKEAASIEGATGWEFFWKITFPTISPMILVNLIYTVIDAFIDFDNPVMNQVITRMSNLDYGFSSALAWVYFAIVGVALAIIMAIASRFVFYQVD